MMAVATGDPALYCAICEHQSVRTAKHQAHLTSFSHKTAQTAFDRGAECGREQTKDNCLLDDNIHDKAAQPVQLEDMQGGELTGTYAQGFDHGRRSAQEEYEALLARVLHSHRERLEVAFAQGKEHGILLTSAGYKDSKCTAAGATRSSHQQQDVGRVDGQEDPAVLPAQPIHTRLLHGDNQGALTTQEADKGIRTSSTGEAVDMEEGSGSDNALEPSQLPHDAEVHVGTTSEEASLRDLSVTSRSVCDTRQGLSVQGVQTAAGESDDGGPAELLQDGSPSDSLENIRAAEVDEEDGSALSTDCNLAALPEEEDMPPASGVWDFGCESAAHIKTLSTSDSGEVLLTKFIKAIWAVRSVLQEAIASAISALKQTYPH